MQNLMNLEAIRDILRLFREINRLKTMQLELPQLKNQYGDLVNELLSVEVGDSETGEKLALRALEVDEAIQEAMSAHHYIRKLEEELTHKYGFLRSGAAAWQKTAANCKKT